MIPEKFSFWKKKAYKAKAELERLLQEKTDELAILTEQQTSLINVEMKLKEETANAMQYYGDNLKKTEVFNYIDEFISTK